MQSSNVRRHGNSTVIGIPRNILQQLDWKDGDAVVLIVKESPLGGTFGTQKTLEIEKLVRAKDLLDTQKRKQ